MTVIAILALYSSLLTSFITYPGFEPQIDTFSRLAEAIDKNEIEAGSIAGSAPYVVIKSEKSSLLRSLSKSVLHSGSKNLALSIPDGVKMAAEREKFAFIFTKTAVMTEANMNYKAQKLFVSEDSNGGARFIKNDTYRDTGSLLDGNKTDHFPPCALPVLEIQLSTTHAAIGQNLSLTILGTSYV
ncbi:hypothetical protein JTE90_015902 [Oedothorax gibbosus]|uniref:Uncharacterized protein n=1 Tax=Oedothorax gibbosus TaxID=931172 RepID=A0AAV6VT92_9ARAC|nr:hypothetical protein JTE90_015902 [Oedothorax gibbosus]